MEFKKEKQKVSYSGMEIAVIGMAGRFPGAENIDKFWNNLKNGVDSIFFFTDEELKETGINSGLLEHPDYVKAKGFLEDIEYFDAHFFGYIPLEAEVMDPQLRIFHECVWEALEDAGYDAGLYPQRIGIYTGASSSLYWEGLTLLSGAGGSIDSFTKLNLRDKDFLSTHISYKLGLTGPSFSMQTACSTSLVAIHLAVQALLNGECEMALAGGISISLPYKCGYLYQEGMILSPDGVCRPFDARAQGTIGGDGVGVVVLKPLEEAIEERDHIYAVIKGSAINNDGQRKVGFTAPSVEGQAEAIHPALYAAEVEPESISYVEAHGTGTVLGDPVEVEALTLAFNTDKRGYCAIGSVKSNIGHLDTAAGVAGFIKTVLALHHRLIPPSLHVENPNPKIDFENSPFYVNTTLKKWDSNGGLLRAGVSSFGIGGTNAHVILEEAPRNDEKGGAALRQEERAYKLIPLSARTESALHTVSKNLLKFVEENPGITLADVAYTLSIGRKTFKHRNAVVCSDVSELKEALSLGSHPNMQAFISGEEKRPIVFMFSGQGSQYVNMGRELYKTEPLFHEEMDRCFEILNGLVDYNIKEILYPDDLVSDVSEVNSPVSYKSYSSNRSDKSNMSYKNIHQTEIAQPLLFIFEYALAKLLMKWGIKPSAMIGHSIGEYTAAHLSGVFSLEEAIKLVTLRGRLMQSMPFGSMLSVPLPRETLEPLLNEEISLAAINSSSLCVVSGTHQAIDEFAGQLERKGYPTRRLHTSHAFHSKMMAPAVDPFKEEIGRIRFKKPEIPYISNVTGAWITVEDAAAPGYWADHLIKTVRLSEGFEKLLKKSNYIFIEVGPGKTLSTFVRQHSQKQLEHMVINLTPHANEKTPADRYLLDKLGQLWLYGAKIDWPGFYENEKPYRISLPTYPFERQRYRIKGDPFKMDVMKSRESLMKKTEVSDWFYIPSWECSPLVSHNPGEDVSTSWLLFVDDEVVGLGAALAKRLTREQQDVIMVKKGKAFSKKSDHLYIINPREPGDYDALTIEIQACKKTLGRTVHLWTAAADSPGDSPGERFENQQFLGFYSILFLIHSLTRHPVTNDLGLTVVTANAQDLPGQEALCPEKTTMLGLMKVIPQEYPHIRCRCIDIIPPAPGSPEQDRMVETLRDEFTDKNTDTDIALRDHRRWTRTYKQFPLVKSKQTPLLLKEKGVYLITGGLGGIGLILARDLVKRVKAKLLLTGRSSFPAKNTWQNWLSTHDEEDIISVKIREFQQMEASGGEILVFSADAANPGQMQQVFVQAEERFGRIDGVIHAAGITKGRFFPCPLEKIDRHVSHMQFQAKVYGTLVLEQILQTREVDFCLLVSSLSTVLGGMGFGAYAAANYFMDAFVQKIRQSNPGRTCWISVNWDGWQLQEENPGNASTKDERHEMGITPAEGVEAFQCIFSVKHIDQVVVSISDLQTRIEQWIKREFLEEEEEPGDKEPDALQLRPALSTPYIEPTNQLEQTLVDLWQEFFGISPIGIRDDFFELGGDSLKLMTICSKIHKSLDVLIPMAQFFSTPHIRGLAKYIVHSKKTTYSLITPVEKKEYYEMSSAQKRMYIIWEQDKNSVSYNMEMILILEGDLDLNQLENTFRELIKRHESLRTSFDVIQQGPVQKVHDDAVFAIQVYDRGRPDQAPGDEEKEERRIIKEFTKPFDLYHAPMIRVGIRKKEKSSHLVMVCMHHIISDGVSMSLFVKECMQLYQGEELPGLRIQYKDFSHWQNTAKVREAVKKQENYWLKEFQGQLPALKLPTDYARPPVFSFEGKTLSFYLGPSETKGLNEIGKREEASLFMVVVAIFNIFLSKITRQEDILIGTVTFGRSQEELEQLIGMFVNTLVLRNFPAEVKPFNGFLQEVKKKTLEAFENQDYQFEDLVDKVAKTRDKSHHPMFDAALALQNVETPEVKIPRLTLKPYPGYETLTCKFDLLLEVYEANDRMRFDFTYSTKLFKRETIEKFGIYLKEIVFNAIKDPTMKLTGIKKSPETKGDEIQALLDGDLENE